MLYTLAYGRPILWMQIVHCAVCAKLSHVHNEDRGVIHEIYDNIYIHTLRTHSVLAT